jgi:hypothetical protein
LGLAVAGLAGLAGCASTDDGGGAVPPVEPAEVVVTTASTPDPASSVPVPVPVPVRERLAVLAVDDRPSPGAPYRRDDWSHWDDVDGNGCDARQDALLRWSTAVPTLDPDRRCKVVAGVWVSPYDGAIASSPSQIEIDHLVPLAEAHRSGGWRWDPAQRRRFANDPIELVATSSPSNQSKGDDRPDEWRPSRTEAWCAYADAWVVVKATYELTVTTSERDALGQMLDTCTSTSERWPTP